MDSPNVSHLNQLGFTVVELLVALAIFATLAGLGLGFGLDFYRQYSFHSDVSVLAENLSMARRQSMVQLYGQEHGVHVEGGRYVVFRGPMPVTFDPSDPANREVLAPSLSLPQDSSFEIIFELLSGRARNGLGQPCEVEVRNCTLNLTYFGQSQAISISSEGAIIW